MEPSQETLLHMLPATVAALSHRSPRCICDRMHTSARSLSKRQHRPSPTGRRLMEGVCSHVPRVQLLRSLAAEMRLPACFLHGVQMGVPHL